MTFKPTTWFRIAAVLAVINLVGAGFAIGQAQLPHAAVHVVLALGFAWWAGWLRQRPGGREVQPGPTRLTRSRRSKRSRPTCASCGRS